ncbi:hypothetical protein [Luteitalea sp.]|uniref:hypothetical protein n=1 Tax=Luteitalea sp. TaxID=2004800 RepID=UPI0025C18560|nr:hypothetical protein [Luteitalea sp.]
MQYKPISEAIGEPDNRHRKPTTVGRLIRRLMLLDAMLSDERIENANEGLVDLNRASWNRVTSWLQGLEGLRRVARPQRETTVTLSRSSR